MDADDTKDLLLPEEKRDVPVRVAESHSPVEHPAERRPAPAPVPPPAPASPPPPARASAPTPGDDDRATGAALLAALQRVERLLSDMRGALSSAASESRHREYSAGRLIGSILQALVLGLVLWALSDWVFGEDPQQLLIKLSFAAVFQLGTLTAFVWGRGVD